MSNWICPTVKHLWNDTVFVLLILFGFVINATADHLGPFSLHLLLLHGLAFRTSVNLYSERVGWQSAKKTCFCEQQEMYERHILPVTYCKRFWRNIPPSLTLPLFRQYESCLEIRLWFEGTICLCLDPQKWFWSLQEILLAINYWTLVFWQTCPPRFDITENYHHTIVGTTICFPFELRNFNRLLHFYVFF